ncbi:unnamed protein product [Peniophora sp. CBMAI 1063]|nr:unnamed protein product [Peniophora sp. CBMAI 1063]
MDSQLIPWTGPGQPTDVIDVKLLAKRLDVFYKGIPDRFSRIERAMSRVCTALQFLQILVPHCKPSEVTLRYFWELLMIEMDKALYLIVKFKENEVYDPILEYIQGVMRTRENSVDQSLSLEYIEQKVKEGVPEKVIWPQEGDPAWLGDTQWWSGLPATVKARRADIPGAVTRADMGEYFKSIAYLKLPDRPIDKTERQIAKLLESLAKPSLAQLLRGPGPSNVAQKKMKAGGSAGGTGGTRGTGGTGGTGGSARDIGGSAVLEALQPEVPMRKRARLKPGQGAKIAAAKEKEEAEKHARKMRIEEGDDDDDADYQANPDSDAGSDFAPSEPAPSRSRSAAVRASAVPERLAEPPVAKSKRTLKWGVPTGDDIRASITFLESEDEILKQAKRAGTISATQFWNLRAIHGIRNDAPLNPGPCKDCIAANKPCIFRGLAKKGKSVCVLCQIRRHKCDDCSSFSPETRTSPAIWNPDPNLRTAMINKLLDLKLITQDRLNAWFDAKGNVMSKPGDDILIAEAAVARKRAKTEPRTTQIPPSSADEAAVDRATSHMLHEDVDMADDTGATLETPLMPDADDTPAQSDAGARSKRPRVSNDAAGGSSLADTRPRKRPALTIQTSKRQSIRQAVYVNPPPASPSLLSASVQPGAPGEFAPRSIPPLVRQAIGPDSTPAHANTLLDARTEYLMTMRSAGERYSERIHTIQPQIQQDELLSSFMESQRTLMEQVQTLSTLFESYIASRTTGASPVSDTEHHTASSPHHASPGPSYMPVDEPELTGFDINNVLSNEPARETPQHTAIANDGAEHPLSPVPPLPPFKEVPRVSASRSASPARPASTASTAGGDGTAGTADGSSTASTADVVQQPMQSFMLGSPSPVMAASQPESAPQIPLDRDSDEDSGSAELPGLSHATPTVVQLPGLDGYESDAMSPVLHTASTPVREPEPAPRDTASSVVDQLPIDGEDSGSEDTGEAIQPSFPAEAAPQLGDKENSSLKSLPADGQPISTTDQLPVDADSDHDSPVNSGAPAQLPMDEDEE